MKRILVVAVLMGCGGSGAYQGEYTCDIQPFVVSAEYPINCEVMQRNVSLALEILDETGIVRADEVQPTFQGLNIYVTNYLYLEELGNNESRVAEYGTYGVVLSYNTDALLHELLHHVDYRRLAVGSRWHLGWQEWGWNAAAERYNRSFRSPSFDNNGPLTIPVPPR